MLCVCVCVSSETQSLVLSMLCARAQQTSENQTWALLGKAFQGQAQHVPRHRGLKHTAQFRGQQEVLEYTEQRGGSKGTSSWRNTPLA